MERIFAILPVKELTKYQRELVITLTDSLILSGSQAGDDGSGIAWVDTRSQKRATTNSMRNAWLYRDTYPAREIVLREQWNRAVWSIPNSVGVILGQTTELFSADTIVSNIAPFGFRMVEETLYGVHAGWILDSYTLAYTNKCKIDMKYKVDSANLFCALAMYEEKQYSSILAKAAAVGKIATVFTRKGKVYIYCCSTADLVQVFFPEINCTVLASTTKMIEDATRLSDIDHDKATLHSVMKNKLWKYNFHMGVMAA